MARNPTNHPFRDLRTLFSQGALGGWSDSQLIERFLDRDNLGREDAFAALVQRHGPMVWRVCRRMLAGSADADDAFQAVFLVLARKGATLRRGDGLKPWLYGVAVRTAKEARRRAARRLAREGGVMDESRAVSLPAEDHADLLSLLDEELERLPERFRELILLCDLDGVSRAEAARQLNLPEGTVSSRLARGRALLRDRLTRRGVSLGTGLIAGSIRKTSSAAFPEGLVDSTARLALDFVSGGIADGVVPSAVKSLAEGVIRMISLTKMKLIAGALFALGVTGSLALAIGPAGKQDERKTPPPAAAVKPDETPKDKEKPSPGPLRIHGIVVDQNDQPVPGAEVRAAPLAEYEGRGVTGPDGSFSILAPLSRIEGVSVLGSNANGDRIGIFSYGYSLDRKAAEAPARIVLKPARSVAVQVTDAAQKPIAKAGIEVVAGTATIAAATTDMNGRATLHVPTDARVTWIVAMKPGQGLDYRGYGKIENRMPLDGIPAVELPASAALTLDGGLTARIKAIDRDGKPLTGVRFRPWLLQKEGRESTLNYVSGMLAATTGPDGVATFDWLPPWERLLQFWPSLEGYARRRVVVKEGETGIVTAKLLHHEAIRGRVVQADGSPARGVLVKADGSGHGSDLGTGTARTSGDGTYEMFVPPGEGYAVYIEDSEQAAPSRLDVIVREGKPVSNVDFTLSSGTLVRGRMTFGPHDRPVPEQFVTIYENGAQAPADFRVPGDRMEHIIQRRSGVLTDKDGRFSIRLGPGVYTVIEPSHQEWRELTIRDEPERVLDYHLDRPLRGLLTGQVTFQGKPVAGAEVEIATADFQGEYRRVRTDDEGRFQALRWLDKAFVHAKSADGSLATIVDVGQTDPTVTVELAPTTTASGILLDEDGKPAANRPLIWGRRVFHNERRSLSSQWLSPRVVTDAQGRFTLPSLVVGQIYDFALARDNDYLRAGRVQPKNAEPIDLGTLKAGAYVPPEEMSPPPAATPPQQSK